MATRTRKVLLRITDVVLGFVLAIVVGAALLILTQCTEVAKEPMTSAQVWEAVKACNRRRMAVRFETDAQRRPTSYSCASKRRGEF